ncbi:hypothetical protein [Cerasicoccus fimbriatus]|uniref:hypothetical protein n=1 Tax=Cerasicoccus fimbriatus TaxID=3014554 RepID=UPI0022B2BAB3|nr:hypothetical protein [Cerasicoccus sp. TK19100]
MIILCDLTLLDGSETEEKVTAKSREQALTIIERKYGRFLSCDFYHVDGDKTYFLGQATPIHDAGEGGLSELKFSDTSDIPENDVVTNQYAESRILEELQKTNLHLSGIKFTLRVILALIVPVIFYGIKVTIQ